MKMADFWEKAEEALKVTEWAYQNGCYNEAVSRSYFAALRAGFGVVRVHWVETREDNKDRALGSSKLCDRMRSPPQTCAEGTRFYPE
jgi:hypothetical protein